jgi:hypothetical protein
MLPTRPRPVPSTQIGCRSGRPSSSPPSWKRAQVLPEPTGCPQNRLFRCQTASEWRHLASQRAALLQQIGLSAALGRARNPVKHGIRRSQVPSILCTKLQYRRPGPQPSLSERHEMSLLRLGSYMIHTTRTADLSLRETAWIWAGSPRKRELVSDHIGSHNRAAGGELIGKSWGFCFACRRHPVGRPSLEVWQGSDSRC